jgi:hypothetical protein
MAGLNPIETDPSTDVVSTSETLKVRFKFRLNERLKTRRIRIGESIRNLIGFPPKARGTSHWCCS